jgi:hypothetical protein
MKTTTAVNIVTIKWGNRYPMTLVNRLANAVRDHGLPDAKIICFTDDPSGANEKVECRPLPKINLPEKYQWTFWRKIALYDPELGLQGACLYFDLDVIITGDLSPLLADWDGEPRFIKNWVGKKTAKKSRYDRVNSSVVLFPGSQCGEVYEEFRRNRDRILSDYPGDQGFTYDCLAERASFFREGLCVSFKKHCLPKFPLNLILPPRIPNDASVVIFHGHPDPDEARNGYRGGKLRRWNRPADWLNEVT